MMTCQVLVLGQNTRGVTKAFQVQLNQQQQANTTELHQLQVLVPNQQHDGDLQFEFQQEDVIQLDQQPLGGLDQVHLGFVHTFTPPVVPDSLKNAFGPIPEFQKPSFGTMESSNASTSGPCPMAIRCWAKFFASVDRSLSIVTIPTQWVDFFTLMMLKQGSYDWTKEFLNSQAWPFFRNTL